MVAIGCSFEENIVATIIPFIRPRCIPEANTAIELYGASLGNVITGNQVIGYQNGYSDWVLPDPFRGRVL